MSATVHIGSQNEFQRILGSSTVVVVDFYADWCGPCKMIAPTFESLSTKYSKPGKITFCKVNTDSQSDVAQAYGIRAMPTFLIFKSGSVIETIQGANPAGLTAAVEKAVKLAASAAAGAGFSTPGRKLGGSGPTSTGGGLSLGRLFRLNAGSFNLVNVLLTFFGLYFVSLFSFDPYKAAENSQFNVYKPRNTGRSTSTQGNGQRLGGKARPSSGFRTLADLGES